MIIAAVIAVIKMMTATITPPMIPGMLAVMVGDLLQPFLVVSEDMATRQSESRVMFTPATMILASLLLTQFSIRVINAELAVCVVPSILARNIRELCLQYNC